MPRSISTKSQSSTSSSLTKAMASQRSTSPAIPRPHSPTETSDPTSATGSHKSAKSQSSDDSDEEVIYKDARTGVEWAEGLHGWEPRWTCLPKLEAIETVCREALGLTPEDMCSVSFYAAGSFNRVYLVQYKKGKLTSQAIMRIPLPVEPGNKTECEVTTMRFVRRHTSIPVPRVIAFNDDDENEIGFEWILMEFVSGNSLHKRWRKLSLEQKTYVTEQIAEFNSQLFKHEFKGIGTLRPRSKGTKGPKPGALLARDYFMGDHFDYDVPRGPFRSSYDWMQSFLQVQTIDQTNQSNNRNDEEDRRDAKYRLGALGKLKRLLPKVLPEVQHPTERTVLWHDDLHEQNILIDEDCKITGILDWEFAFAAPVWMATKFPWFLRSNMREEKPNPANYGPWDQNDPESNTEAGMLLTKEEQIEYEATWVDDEGKPPVYWDHLEDHEKTQLRKVYTAKMTELWPEYKTLATQSEFKNDFVDAVNELYNAFPNCVANIWKWVDNISLGDFTRFRIVLHSGTGRSDDDLDPQFRKTRPVEKDENESDSEIEAGFLSSDDEDISDWDGDKDDDKNENGDEEDETVDESKEDDYEDGDEKVKKRGVEVVDEDREKDQVLEVKTHERNAEDRIFNVQIPAPVIHHKRTLDTDEEESHHAKKLRADDAEEEVRADTVSGITTAIAKAPPVPTIVSVFACVVLFVVASLFLN